MAHHHGVVVRYHVDARMEDDKVEQRQWEKCKDAVRCVYIGRGRRSRKQRQLGSLVMITWWIAAVIATAVMLAGYSGQARDATHHCSRYRYGEYVLRSLCTYAPWDAVFRTPLLTRGPEMASSSLCGLSDVCSGTEAHAMQAML